MNENYEIIHKGTGYEIPNTIVKCKKCENIFKTSIHSLNRKNYKICPFCEIVSKNATKEQAEYKLKSINEEYEIIEFRSMTSSTVRHRCGFINENANITRIISRNSGNCINCSHKSIAYTPEYVKEEIRRVTNGEYEVLSDYKREDKPFLMKHTLCGHEWMVRRRNFIYKGTRCPKCVSLKLRSKGVEFIGRYFNENNIDFEVEKTYELCKSKRTLPFDFFLEKQNLLIEFDGEMHFHKRRDNNRNYALQKLRDAHTHDLIKNKFCKDSKINLLRIPYDISYSDIKTILDEYFRFGDISSTTIKNLNIYYNTENKEYYNRYSEE